MLTDNGSAYRGDVHALACRTLGIRHLRTRPYRPQTNGKAERFIRTMLDGWAYGAIYATSTERTAPLTAGSGTTTIAADTQRSAANPQPTAEQPAWDLQVCDRGDQRGRPLDERGLVRLQLLLAMPAVKSCRTLSRTGVSIPDSTSMTARPQNGTSSAE